MMHRLMVWFAVGVAVLMFTGCDPGLIASLSTGELDVSGTDALSVVARFPFDGAVEDRAAGDEAGPFVFIDEGGVPEFTTGHDGTANGALSFENPQMAGGDLPTPTFVSDDEIMPRAFSFWARLPELPPVEDGTTYQSHQIELTMRPAADSIVPDFAFYGSGVARVSARIDRRLGWWGFDLDIYSERTSVRLGGSSDDPRAGEWQHIVCGADSLGFLQLYVNGARQGVSRVPMAMWPAPSQVAFQLRASYNGNGTPADVVPDTPFAVDDLIILASPITREIAEGLYAGTIP